MSSFLDGGVGYSIRSPAISRLSIQDIVKQNVTLKKNCSTKIVSQDGCSFSLHTTHYQHPQLIHCKSSCSAGTVFL